MDISSVAIDGIILVPLINGLVQVAKSMGLSDKYCAITALIIGVVLGAIYSFMMKDIRLISGIIMGVACGLFSQNLYDTVHDMKKQDRE